MLRLIKNMIIIGAVLLCLLSVSGCSDGRMPQGETKFIAHRGLSSRYYQNSLHAFEKAAESGFFSAIETDIRMTADGVWVCSHDPDPFDDTSLVISALTFEQACAQPLNRQKGAADREVFLCPFDSYLDVCAAHSIIAVIELKEPLEEAEMLRLIHETEQKLPRSGYILISFIKENIDLALSLDASVAAQLLTLSRKEAASYIAGGYDIGIKQKIASRSMIKKAKKKGLTVNVWTVNNKAAAKRLASYGADYITTDYVLDL